MTVPDSELIRISADLATMSAGFRNEMAVAWPMIGDRVGRPIIASVGSEQHVCVLPARVFRHAIAHRASGVLLAHNHPVATGPSASDRAVTRRLVAAGRVLDVPLLAHLVVEAEAVYELVRGRMLPLSPRRAGDRVA